MIRTRLLIVSMVLLSFLCFSQPVLAGHITLATSPQIKGTLTEEAGVIDFIIVNQGDETAFKVRVSLEPEEQYESLPVTLGDISPGERVKASINFKLLNNPIPGKYPATAKVKYADGNGHPFSIVSPTLVDFKEKTVAKVAGAISPIELNPGSGAMLQVKVDNLDAEPRHFEVFLFTPDEIKTSMPKKTLYLTPGNDGNLGYYLGADSIALGGSNYAIFASISYQEGGLRYSQLVTGRVSVANPAPKDNDSQDNLLEDNTFWLLACTLVFLCAIYIYLDSKTSKR
ncbi:hypothetical protein ACFLRC_03865 [Candidatus Altiarchaeota archaeon]